MHHDAKATRGPAGQTSLQTHAWHNESANVHQVQMACAVHGASCKGTTEQVWKGELALVDTCLGPAGA